MNALFKRLATAFGLFAVFVVLTGLAGAGAQYLGRGSLIAMVGCLLVLWVRYSRKITAWIFDCSRRV